MWEQVIASVWGTTMNCEGERNSRSDGKGRVSRKYWEASERQKKAILSQWCDECNNNCLNVSIGTIELEVWNRGHLQCPDLLKPAIGDGWVVYVLAR
jgi:hypothetical protein